MDKGKCQTVRADDEGFIEVKRKKSSGNKTFKLVLVKLKTLYRPKAKQSVEEMNNSPKTSPFVGTNKASTSARLRLNADNLVIEEVSTGKFVFVDDDGKPLEKVDYLDNTNNEDEVEAVDNETAIIWHQKGLDMAQRACGNNGRIL
ncbi:hypothetical protein Tco_0889941 [Tanacetum coccineum]